MNRLMYVIVFTPDLGSMKSFYRDDMGFEVTSESEFFVAFATGGASLALMAVHPQQKRELELCFHSAALDEDVRALQSRGVKFIDNVKALSFGRVIHARDPEGNLLSLLQPSEPPPASAGTAMTAVVLNSKDVAAQKAWYRDQFGLPIEIDSPWWVEFDAGETHVALHPLVDHDALETHHAGPVTVGFASGDLDEWVEELRVRGVAVRGRHHRSRVRPRSRKFAIRTAMLWCCAILPRRRRSRRSSRRISRPATSRITSRSAASGTRTRRR